MVVVFAQAIFFDSLIQFDFPLINHWDSLINHWDSLINHWDSLINCNFPLINEFLKGMDPLK
jgi:hypothetical protein